MSVLADDMIEMPLWAFWLLLALHTAWTACNWVLYFKSRRLRNEAMDLLDECEANHAEWRTVTWESKP